MRLNGFVLVALVLLLLCVGAYRMGYRHAVEMSSFKHCNHIGSWPEYEACEAEFKRWLR